MLMDYVLNNIKLNYQNSLTHGLESPEAKAPNVFRVLKLAVIRPHPAFSPCYNYKKRDSPSALGVGQRNETRAPRYQ